jgi:hypothetical protein
MTANSTLGREKFDENELSEILYCFSGRSRARLGWGITIALLILAIGPPSTARAQTTPSSAKHGSSLDAVARQCKKGTKKNGKKDLSDAAPDSAGACIEVRSRALDIQEYLQAYGREQKWNLIDEHVAEDAWTFSRKLEKDELLQYSKNDANTERVSWTSGVAFVEIKTLELSEGFVRVQIAARFQGYGQNGDRFAPPKEFWPLISNGTLESHLISVLETHYKSSS